jgi:hypothetical protein
VGRDISKFFYGAYAFEGNENLKPGQPNLVHAHSNIARKVLYRHIVAVMQNLVSRAEVPQPVKSNGLKVQETSDSSTALIEGIPLNSVKLHEEVFKLKNSTVPVASNVCCF